MNTGNEQQSLDLALIGNCQYASLIDTRGSVVWTCFPRFDSPAVFARILDSEHGGHWSIGGAGDGWQTEARYLENTCILSTTWKRAGAESGNAEKFTVTDFAPRFFQNDRYYRPTLLVRKITPVEGRPHVHVSCEPRFRYGEGKPRINFGSNHLTYRDSGSSDRLRLSTNASLTMVAEARAFELTRPLYFALAWDEPFEDDFSILEDFLRRTTAYWRRWCKRTRVPVDYQDAVLRASMTLKLHTFEDTGAVVAATTTSIPEAPDTERTWDYRYCWLRDGAFVIRSLLRMGHSDDAERFCEYLRNLLPPDGTRQFALQPVYGIDARKELDESTVDALSGYRGQGPVRVGNDAYRHVQNDLYGEVVLALAPLFYDKRLLGSELEPVFENIKNLVGAAASSFHEPDAGIWEFRKREDHHVFSKFMCWVALDRAAKIASRMGSLELAHRWEMIAKGMQDEILEKGYNRDVRSFVNTYGGSDLDASLLLMPILGFLPMDDTRIVSTIDRLKGELAADGLLYRYRYADDFGEQRSAFTICTTWMVEALWKAGRCEEARTMFDHLLARRNRFGLLSEDIDPASGELWGNYPQTYSMLGIINCAVRLSPRWEEIF